MVQDDGRASIHSRTGLRNHRTCQFLLEKRRNFQEISRVQQASQSLTRRFHIIQAPNQNLHQPLFTLKQRKSHQVNSHDGHQSFRSTATVPGSEIATGHKARGGITQTVDGEVAVGDAAEVGVVGGAKRG